MKLSLTLTGLFLFVFYRLTTGETRVHIYVSTPMNWTAAQSYCRMHHNDLSTITSEEEHQMLKDAARGNFSDAWIGLRRSSGNPNIWLWSDGQLLYFHILYSNNEKNYDCVYATQLKWHNDLCEVERPFFCYDNFNLIPVTENKTWEEALEYCRSHYIDLASATSQVQLDLMKDAVKSSQTVSAWIGLRFLAGEWLWVNKSFKQLQFQASLTFCPPEPYRCGAFNKTTEQWENRDCEEKLNFICY